ELRDRRKLEERQVEIRSSLTQQMQLHERQKQAEIDTDRKEAQIAAENQRVASEVEARLRAERKRMAIVHQGELAMATRRLRESQLEGALNENFMSDKDQSYNANLVHAVRELQNTGKLLHVTTPLG
ncbi:hypothetical protein T492DRAFT_866451, partial [Pavlovales sp. CCMP2436]